MKKSYILIGLVVLALFTYFSFHGEKIMNEVPITENTSGSEDPPEELDEANLAVLRIGESKTVSGLIITLNKITEDSRCPIEAMCVWAGRLVAEIKLKSDTDEEVLNISTDNSTISFGVFTITLEAVAPKPSVKESMETRNYVLTFKVEK